MIIECNTSGQIIDFDIPEQYKKIAVNCSGGADSSILLLMVVQYLIDNKRDDVTVSVSTCSNDKKGRWNGRKASDVIDYVLRKTGFKNFDMHYTYYRDVQSETYFHEVESKLFTDQRVDLFISGVTSNPPVGAMVVDKDNKIVYLADEMLPERNGTDHVTWYKNGSHAFYTPFSNIDKRFVASMYNSYDADDLLDLTRSCESIPNKNDDIKVFETTPCGKCWWCLERKWAFGRL
jgi:hypothetical protein